MTNAFAWKGSPSIFSTDKTLKPTKVDGKTMSQVATEKAAKRLAETGRNPGTIAGLSPKADRQIKLGRPAR